MRRVWPGSPETPRNNKSTGPTASCFHLFLGVWKPRSNTRTRFLFITSNPVNSYVTFDYVHIHDFVLIRMPRSLLLYHIKRHIFSVISILQRKWCKVTSEDVAVGCKNVVGISVLKFYIPNSIKMRIVFSLLEQVRETINIFVLWKSWNSDSVIFRFPFQLTSVRLISLSRRTFASYLPFWTSPD